MRVTVGVAVHTADATAEAGFEFALSPKLFDACTA